MGKGKVPPQLKGHAFGDGSAKATKAGAKGGRKSPGTGKAASATPASAKGGSAKKPSAMPAKGKAAGKGSGKGKGC